MMLNAKVFLNLLRTSLAKATRRKAQRSRDFMVRG